MTKQITETSKFLSYVLRHAPESIGLTLDREGWADIATLIAAAGQHGERITRELLQTVVDTNDKKRFTISPDGRSIRAAQGHSTASVEIRHVEKRPPALLFHGTASRSVNAIMREGLMPGTRHHVHLSELSSTATAVGQRYGVPVVLEIDAAQMTREGMVFYQADNGVWLTLHVPPAYIRVPGAEQ